MQSLLKTVRLGASTLLVAGLLAGVSMNIPAFAQTPAPTSTSLSESTVKALQEALNRQGIAVSTSGVLNDETRSAIRKYQSQHHLAVTGEPDRATLDKLGVRQSAAPAQSPALAQAAPPASGPQAQAPTPPAPQQPGQMPGGMMMNCPMMQGQMTPGQMQGQMQAMMQMMQGMMQMMQTMHGQMQPGQMQPGQMPGGPMQPRQN